MMKLDDQVCSLELAKRLKDLGVRQESYFCWFKLLDKDNYDVCEKWQICDKERFAEMSAFTVAEFGEMLPIINGYHFQFIKGATLIHGEIYCVRYDILEIDNSIFTDKNPANACAKMLIYLLENGLIKNE